MKSIDYKNKLIPSIIITMTLTMFSGNYSMLLINFHLQRHMGNFLIQVYGPCVLLVVLSWVSFWLNREATADRVSLGKSQYVPIYQPRSNEILMNWHLLLD